MNYITVKELLSRCNGLLVDPLWASWTKDVLLSYYHEALLVVLDKRPESNPVNVEFECSAGVKQTLPEHALKLLEVTCNQNGKAIKFEQKSTLDDNYPEWYAGNTAAQADVFSYDPRNPRYFYLFPGVVAGTKIEMIYAGLPVAITVADVDNASNPAMFPLEPIFVAPVMDYILYRAYTRDSEMVANANRASSHYAAFNQAIAFAQPPQQ